jgi:hypothetical protein
MSVNNSAKIISKSFPGMSIRTKRCCPMKSKGQKHHENILLRKYVKEVNEHGGGGQILRDEDGTTFRMPS